MINCNGFAELSGCADYVIETISDSSRLELLRQNALNPMITKRFCSFFAWHDDCSSSAHFYVLKELIIL